MAHTEPEEKARRQGKWVPCAGAAVVVASAAAGSPDFSAGESRNHQYHAAAHTRPSTPKTKNDIRQP